MKKVFSVLTVSLLVIAMVAVAALPVAADSAQKERMVAAAQEHMPAELFKAYQPMIDNVLKQVSVNEDQADQIIACIEESRDFFKEYKGASLSEYENHEQEFAVDMVNRIAEILGLTVVLTPSSDPDHEHDVVCEVYNASGQKLAEVDGDAIKKTNAPDPSVNFTYVALAVVLVLGAGAAVVVSKKVSA